VGEAVVFHDPMERPKWLNEAPISSAMSNRPYYYSIMSLHSVKSPVAYEIAR